MRLIDADVLKQHIDKLPALPDGNFAGNHSALKALINMQPTFEPSTNCSEVPNSSDAISRQAAIDALCKVGCGSGYCGISCDDVKAIEQLPSLHPQRTGRQMMGAEKTLVNVNKGQDAYSVIGNYILNHVTAIEDMIAVIQINGVIIKELYMVDVDADRYFYWKSDWWEGEEDVALLDFFPVSDAEVIPAADVVPVVHGKWIPHREKSREYIGTVLVHVMYDYWLCDTCGYRVENGQPTYNFCPNCGARMDGGKED